MRAVCVRARVLHLFTEERFIRGLAVFLFLTNHHCCEILWVHFTNTTRHFWQFLRPVWSPNPFSLHTHPLHLLALGNSLSLSLPLFLAAWLIFTGGSTQAKKRLIRCMLSTLVRKGFLMIVKNAQKSQAKKEKKSRKRNAQWNEWL